MQILPDRQNRGELVRLLILGEILTRRGELGPLARLWRPAPKPAAPRNTPAARPERHEG